MPIVPNHESDVDVSQTTHCFRSAAGDLSIRQSTPCAWFHVSEFISIFNQLEQNLSSSLSRRLLHASYVHPFAGFFEEPILRKKPFFSSKLAHISRMFDAWAKQRVLTGRGMASVIEWPVRFHVDQPIHAGIEVGEIIHTVERLTGLSWKATWKDDGGRNLMIHLECIEMPIQTGPSNLVKNGVEVDFGIEWIRNMPQINGAPIMFLTTASIGEFVRLLNEVATPKAPEKDRFPDLESALEKLLIEIIGESMKSQLPLILDWNNDHGVIMEHLIDRGFIRAYESSTEEIRYESIMPRSFTCAPIVSAWESSTGELAVVKMSSIGHNEYTISFQSQISKNRILDSRKQSTAVKPFIRSKDGTNGPPVGK